MAVATTNNTQPIFTLSLDSGLAIAKSTEQTEVTYRDSQACLIEGQIERALINSFDFKRAFKQLGTIATIQRALDSNDSSLFQASLLALKAEDVQILRKDVQFLDRLNSRIRTAFYDFQASAIDSVQLDNSSGEQVVRRVYPSLRPLLDVAGYVHATLLQGLSLNSYENQPTNLLAIISELSRVKKGRQAAELTYLALKRGYDLPDTTIMWSLVLAGKQLCNEQDVANYAALAVTALKSGKLNTSKPGIVGVLDVVLATLGSPFSLRERGYDRFYGERDLVDFAQRIEKAGELAICMVESGVRMNDQRTSGRMNLQVCSMTTVAGGLYIAAQEIKYPDNRNAIKELRSKFSSIPRYDSITRYARELIFPDMLEMSENLLSQALQLTNSCLCSDKNAGSYYPIRGSTLNQLFRVIAASGMELGPYELELVASIVKNASRHPEISRQLYSHAFTTFLEYLHSRYPDNAAARRAAVEITANLLRAGVMPAQDLVCQAGKLASAIAQEAQDFWETWFEEGDFNFERNSQLIQTMKMAQMDEALINNFVQTSAIVERQKSPVRSLVGGLDGKSGGRGVMWHSFTDLARVMLPSLN